MYINISTNVSGSLNKLLLFFTRSFDKHMSQARPTCIEQLTNACFSFNQCLSIIGQTFVAIYTHFRQTFVEISTNVCRTIDKYTSFFRPMFVDHYTNFCGYLHALCVDIPIEWFVINVIGRLMIGCSSIVRHVSDDKIMLMHSLEARHFCDANVSINCWKMGPMY
jgi:hypothetical protein